MNKTAPPLKNMSNQNNIFDAKHDYFFNILILFLESKREKGKRRTLQ